MPSRWTAKHTTELVDLLKDGTFDPSNTTNEYLEQLFEDLDDSSILNNVGLAKFKSHYREKSAIYLVDQGIQAANSDDEKSSECDNKKK